MAFQGREYIEYADYLNADTGSFAKNNNTHHEEAAYRAVTSRAYYGAFLEARDFLGLQNAYDKSMHSLVGSAMKKKNRKIANALSALKRLRVKADYRNQEVMTLQDAKNSLRNAKNIIAYIDK
jgi:uncharacterized protein (UPF0332 family)